MAPSGHHSASALGLDYHQRTQQSPGKSTSSFETVIAWRHLLTSTRTCPWSSVGFIRPCETRVFFFYTRMLLYTLYIFLKKNNHHVQTLTPDVQKCRSEIQRSRSLEDAFRLATNIYRTYVFFLATFIKQSR